MRRLTVCGSSRLSYAHRHAMVMVRGFGVPSCSPRSLCCLLILATGWIGPLLWTLDLVHPGEHSSVTYEYLRQAQCTVAKTHIQKERHGNLVRYIVILRPSPPPHPPPHPPSPQN